MPSGASLVLGAFVARKAPLALCASRRPCGGWPLLTHAKVMKTFEQQRSRIGAIYGMVMRTSFGQGKTDFVWSPKCHHHPGCEINGLTQSSQKSRAPRQVKKAQPALAAISFATFLRRIGLATFHYKFRGLPIFPAHRDGITLGFGFVSIRRSTKGYSHTDGRTGFGAPHVKPSVRPFIFPLAFSAPTAPGSPVPNKKARIPALPRQSFTVPALVKRPHLAIFAALPCAGYEGAPTGGRPASIA